ncbi:MAG: dihydroorotate dehydrogenase electron transfer subunit, partial [Muribaculaceae bacterium]|nr:dihydroorotate dehydrogenase electron transfer subunit [Muribaculaceae bacterium]
KPVGKGSKRLVNMHPGEEMQILLPLGNSFTIEKPEGSYLLVGGGVGIAPLLYLSRSLSSQGLRPTLLLGGASAADLELAEEFEKHGEVFTTTIDGSMGGAGLVTNHDVMHKTYDTIFCCGPTPMMKAVAKIARENSIPMQASLENHMACGLGACLCCVENTITGNRCVCTEGPIFPIDELNW